MPNDIAFRYVHAGKIAVGAERVKYFSNDGGCRPCARVRRLLIWIADLADVRRPQLMSVVHVKCVNELILQYLVADQKDAIGHDGWCRITIAKTRLLPQ